MKIGLYFCTCGTNISATVDAEKVMAELTAHFAGSYAAKVEFICSDEGRSFLKDHLLANIGPIGSSWQPAHRGSTKAPSCKSWPRPG